MELREWKYMNTPATTSASTSSNTGFKKRLEKLIKYHGNNLPIDVDYLMVGLLTKDKLEFAEQYDDGQVVEYKISIDPTSEDWQVRIFVNRQLDEELKGTGWPELLKTLRPYIVVPETRELEYKNLLTEWVAMNNKTSSTGYKKRFEKLIKYHIDHASSELERVNNKVINEYDFHLSEHYNTGSDEFNRTIIVSVNKYTDEFFLSIFVDGKEVYHNVYKSYEEVLEILTGSYMFLPDEGTQEYDDLLTESLNEWQLMNPPQPATSKNPYTRGQAYRYNRLLDQITSDGIAKYKLHKITNNTLDITVDTKKTKDLNIKITYDPATEDYTMVTNGSSTLEGCDYEEDILPLLQAGAVINNTDLCESTGSIADDFRLYDILWEDVDVEEYNMVLGRTQYNLYNDSDLDAYLTQSARLMRKPVGNEKPLEFFKLQKINKMLRTPKYSNEKKLAAKLLRVRAELEKSFN